MLLESYFSQCLMTLIFNDLGPQSKNYMTHLVESTISGHLMAIKVACGTCTGILDLKRAINRNLDFTLGFSSESLHATTFSNQWLLLTMATLFSTQHKHWVKSEKHLSILFNLGMHRIFFASLIVPYFILIFFEDG